MWFIHKRKCYSVITRNELLMYITTWMNVKCILLSERSQNQRDTYFMMPLGEILKKKKKTLTIGMKNRILVSQGYRNGGTG